MPRIKTIANRVSQILFEVVFSSPSAWIIVFALYLVYYYLLGERVPVNGGFGWDGAGYASLTASFFSNPVIGSYHLTRILPPFLAYLPIRILSLSPTPSTIITSYYVMHSILIISSAILYYKCLCAFKLSKEIKTLGLILFLFSLMVAKFFPYYPILLDQDGFFWATLSLYLYLYRKTFLLILITPIAGFCWAVVLPFNLLLILFPRKDENEKPEIIFIEKMSLRLISTFVTTSIFIGIAVYVVFYDPDPLIGNVSRYSWYPQSSTAVTAIYASFVFFYFSIISPISLFKNITLRSVLGAVFAVLIWLGIKHLVSNYWITVIPDPKQSMLYGVKVQFWYNAVKPALFLIANAIFFGLMYLLIFTYFKKFTLACTSIGLGMALVVLISLLATIGIESRMWVYAYPFLSLSCILALKEHGKKRLVLYFWVILAIFASRIWYPFNKDGGPGDGTIIDFPGQHYFMTQGPWMAWSTYYIQGAVVVVVFMLLIGIKYLANKSENRQLLTR